MRLLTLLQGGSAQQRCGRFFFGESPRALSSGLGERSRQVLDERLGWVPAGAVHVM